MPYTPLDQTRVLWDASGRPYWASTDGKTRHYIPPMAAAQYRDDPRMLAWAASQGFQLQRDAQGDIAGMDIAPGAGAGGNRPLDFRSGRQWDTERGEYRTGFDWGDVVTLGAGGLVGAGAASAIGGGGAVSAAPAAAAPGGAAPVAATGVGGAAGPGIGLSQTGLFAPSAGIGATGVGSSVPLGGMTTAAGTAGASGAAGIGSKLASGAKDFLGELASPQGAAGLAALIAGLSSQGSGQQNTEELQHIQAMTEARMRRTDPLHQVATALAFGRMPTNYRQGIQLNNVPLPE
jgi:hypothetical protein